MQNNRLKVVEITQDGSPTLRMDGNPLDPQYTEQMHYSTGAASETIYIYGEAIKRAQSLMPGHDTNFLVVGLGLGYIEILISLLSGGEFKQIHSFEKDLDLISDFKNWCEQKDLSLYDRVAQSLMNHVQSPLTIAAVQNLLKEKLIIHEALENPRNSLSQKFNVICYDAFSSLMDEGLWNSDFLDEFIKNYSADVCVFASYSKTGALNRALKNNGFTVIQRKGFSTKRECTLAIKLCR